MRLNGGMKNEMRIATKGRNTALIYLLGICAIALLVVFGTISGASAQDDGPTIDFDMGGWAAETVTDTDPGGSDRATWEALTSTYLSVQDRAPGSHATASGRWGCEDLRCYYGTLSWSNVTPNQEHGKAAYTITLERNAPSADQIGIPDGSFASSVVPTVVSLTVPDASTSELILPIPWAAGIVTITGAPGSQASFTHSNPGLRPLLGDAFGTRDTRSASTLATDEESSLPMIVSVWPRAEGATHYEVGYTFRTRSDDPAQRLTKVTRIVSVSQIAYTYEDFNANWSQARNRAELEALTNSDFASGGGWIGVVTTLPKLLAGAEGWPSKEAAAETEAFDALGEGRNAVGIRIKPVLACATAEDTDDLSDICSKGINKMAPQAEYGRQGKISYVRFEGDTMEEWVSSAGTAR